MLKALLQLAAAQGKQGIAQKLVNAGAEVGDALHAAVGSGHVDVAGGPLESGAHPSTRRRHGETRRHVAARFGLTEMVELLLLKGADTEEVDNDARTPLSLYCSIS